MLSNLETIGTARPPTSRPLSLVTVLYEDLPAGLRARALMESVDGWIDAPAPFKLDLWRFDWLREHSLANVSLGLARRAASVLISASTNNPLPTVAEKWIISWARTRQDHSSSAPLILVLPNQNGVNFDQHPVHNRLALIAECYGVNFICESPRSATARDEVHVRGFETAPFSVPVKPFEQRAYCGFS